MRDWTEVGFSSIYYILKKLEREGLIEGHLEEAERGPARKVFRATRAGQEAYHAGVLDVLSVPRRWYSPFLLGLAALPGIPVSEALTALRQYCDALETRREYVQGNWAQQRPLPLFIEAMFDHSITVIETEKEWIERLIQKIEGGGYY